MKLTCIVSLLILLCYLPSFSLNNTRQSVKHNSLLAMVDPSDSGSSITLEQANKKAEATENNRSRFFPIFFSPLIIVMIVMIAKRRKKLSAGKSMN